MALPKSPLGDNLYVTSCVLCKHGIYRDAKTREVQSVRWRRPLGQVHPECAERAS